MKLINRLVGLPIAWLERVKLTFGLPEALVMSLIGVAIASVATYYLAH